MMSTPPNQTDPTTIPMSRRRGQTFSVRVVKYWNKLVAFVVTAPSVNIFKNRLEKVWREHSSTKTTTPSTCIPQINSLHLYTLLKPLFCLCGFFLTRCGLLFTIINHNQVIYQQTAFQLLILTYFLAEAMLALFNKSLESADTPHE